MCTSYLKLGSFFLLLLSLVSCNKDDEGEDDLLPEPSGPTLRLEVNGAKDLSSLVVDVGDTLYLSTTAAADAYLRTLAGYKLVDGNREVLFEEIISDTVLAETSIDSLEQYINYALSGKEIKYLFIVTDRLDQKDSLEFTINVNQSPIIIRENITLAPYRHPSLANFYNILEDTVYFPSNLRTSTKNQQVVDFIVSYTKDAGMSFTSPDDPEASVTWDQYVNFQWPFQSPNSTRFVAVDESVDFDAVITSAQLDNVFTGPEATSLSTLAEEDVFAFQLDASRDGKVGILKVVDITGNTESTRSITISLKIQE